MSEKEVTWDVFQDPMGWLNDEAEANMSDMCVTWEVFQDPMGWLKEEASMNMLLM